MKSELTKLLAEADAAQLHGHGYTTYGSDVYQAWMRDRQRLTDLIARLATRLRNVNARLQLEKNS